ncbi:hypothetical protein NQ315_003633 [Exocentrus adspersus]|uniref:Transposase n=1 Tax=Exocentrus adspersus TaxID=1586481 RepID=A0AAV8VC90_9CUCU|nr:hypothetical protein NQ315_003633 [Exocentrus adspersus]
MPQHLTEAQKSWAIAKLEENRSLSEVAAELNVKYIRQNPFATAVKHENRHYFQDLRVAQMRLKQLKALLPAKFFYLHRRVQFANEFLIHGEEFWNNVVFSDEKTFQSCNSGRLRVYRPRNTRFEENYTLTSTNNSGRFSVNVWAWISVNGPGMCYQIDGRLTAEHYINILDNVMLPSVTEVFPDNFTFQHNRHGPMLSEGT